MPVPVDLLAGLPICHGLTSVDLEELASHVEESVLPARSLIIREGDPPGHPIYMLLEGTAEVLKNGADGRDHLISALNAPSVFGEIEVLAGLPAIAGVQAVSEVRLALLKRGVFEELAAQGRPAILKVIKNLASTLAYRLAATDGRLASFFNQSAGGSEEALERVRNVLYSTWHTGSTLPDAGGENTSRAQGKL